MNHLEIEFKNMLNYESYALLKSLYFKDVSPFTQTNFYMDTEDFKLRDKHISLRIRDAGKVKEMTLKIPQQIGVMEYNIPLDDSLLTQDFFEVETLSEPIRSELIRRDIHAPLKVFGALSTERMETEYESGLLVLDASAYLDTEDFELEYEVSDYDSGKQIFDNLLKQHNIPVSVSKNKVQRFYDHLMELQAKNF